MIIRAEKNLRPVFSKEYIMKQYLEAGEIVSVHGVNGELKVYPSTDTAKDFCRLKTLYFDEDGNSPVKVKGARVQKNMALVAFEGISDVDSARKYIGRRLFLNRDDMHLPKGSFFIADLIGARVLDADTGECYGELTDVTSPAGRDVYHIRLENGEERMIPAVKEFVTDISVTQEGATVKIRPIAGLLYDED